MVSSPCTSMCEGLLSFRPDAHPCRTIDLAFRFLVAFPVLIETPDDVSLGRRGIVPFGSEQGRIDRLMRGL